MRLDEALLLSDPVLLERMFYVERYAWLSLTHDMAAVMSIDGAINDTNIHCETVTGFTQSEMLETYLVEYIHYEDRERVLGEMQSLITADISTTAFTFRFLCKDGEYKRLSWNVVFSPEHDSFFCMVKDVTKPDLDTAMRYAYRDLLTGLRNRLFLTDNLPGMLERADQDKCELALLFIDLDGFKAVNDTYGHRVGDVLLKEVARRSEAFVGENDIFIRLGGDEFLAVLQDCRDKDSLAEVAKGLIQRISAPILIEDVELGVGASVGIAVYPRDASDQDDLIHKADAAMYHVKRTGKNGFAFYEDIPDCGC